MNHRIRAGAIITRDDSVLLVGGSGDHGYLWWTPGGAVEGAETWAECAMRETREETGLDIEIGRLAYVREWVTPFNNTHHFEVLFAGLNPSGEIQDPDPGSPGYDARMDGATFVHRDDVSGISPWPKFISTDQFWADHDAGFPETRHLGFEHV